MNNQQYTTRINKISLNQNNNQPMNTQPVTKMQMDSAGREYFDFRG